MANEILYAGLANQRDSELISGNYLMLIGDRNAIQQHNALVYVGDMAGSSSTSKRIPHIGLMAFNQLQAIAEGAALANTAFSDGSTLVSVAPFGKSYERGDVAKFTDSLGIINSATFAEDASLSSAMKLTNLIANVTDDYTTLAGTSGAALTLAQWVTGINLLEINSQAAIGEGDALSLLHPVQVGHLRNAMLTAGGAAQWYPPSQELLKIRGTGDRGRYMGVDIFSSPQCPFMNGVTDRGGAIFLAGAVLWADMSVDTDGDANALVIANKVLFERARTAKSRLTAYVSSAYFGVSKGIDLLGVTVRSSATP